MIKIGNRPVFNQSMYTAGIKTIKDIVDREGIFLSMDQLQTKYPQLIACFLRFQGIKAAIPNQWKNFIRTAPRICANTEENIELCLTVGETSISIKNISSRHFYQKLTMKKTPTAEAKRAEKGFRVQNWGQLYQLPYKCCISTKLQALQYRILHRFIPTRTFLAVRGVIGSSLCPNCFQVDTLQHFLYECGQVKRIWDTILPQISHMFNLQNDFNPIKTVIFGDNTAPVVANLTILLIKQYIVTNKLRRESQTHLRTEAAVKAVVNFYRAEKLVATKNSKLDKFWRKWDKVVSPNATAHIG